MIPNEVREAADRIIDGEPLGGTYAQDAETVAWYVSGLLDAQPQAPYAHRNGETEPPEVPGGYWFRRPDTPPGVFGLVQVWRNGYNGYLYCDKYNEDYNCMDEVPPQDYGENLRWWGPITEPEAGDE